MSITGYIRKTTNIIGEEVIESTLSIKPSNSDVIKSRKKPVLANSIKFNKQVLKDINSMSEINLLIN